MPPRGSFERRLLLALVLFSLVPSLLLIGVGTYLLSETVALHTSPAGWEPVTGTARVLLEAAERSGDDALREAAARHRAELSAALLQVGRLEFLNQRMLRVIPLLALALAGLLVWFAVRAARGIARELARPIHELVGWSERIAREELLPERPERGPGERSEFSVLRDAFRTMSRELALSRARALETERMRAWVTLARSIAHELKNSLAPVRLAVATLERRKAAMPEAAEPLEVIAAESERLEELARAFARFGRLPEGPVSEIDLAEMLDYLLRSHLPPGVAHRLRAPADLPRITGYHDALARAFANLLLNAAEAMGGEGEVTVELAARGEAVEARVLDTGPGIRAGDLARIWDPDFTTKSRGTGLGLGLVRQTIHAHGGTVSARSRPEGGAEFRVRLPMGRPSSGDGRRSSVVGRPSGDAGPVASGGHEVPPDAWHSATADRRPTTDD
jgi:signal transduction histidine kinase